MTETGLPNSMVENGGAQDKAQFRFWRRRLVPLGLLLAGLGLVLALDLDQFLTFDALKENRDLLTGWVAAATASKVSVFGYVNRIA